MPDWERIYRQARYRVRGLDGRWRDARLAGPLALVTAWNPRSRALPAVVNRVRDRQLAAWLDRRGIPRLAGAGGSRDRRWCEPGWAIPHRQARTATLLRRFAQHAAWVVHAGRGRLVWSIPVVAPAAFRIPSPGFYSGP